MRRSLILLGGTFLTACGGYTPTAPSTGSLAITTTTTGQPTGPTGDLSYNLDGGAVQSIAPSTTITLTDLSTGSHTVGLAFPDNCSVAGDDPVTVSVTASQTASVAFAVTCAGVGSIQVVTSTIGTNQDADGYSFTIDNGLPQPIGINGSVTLADFVAGPHTVVLSGIASNCAIQGDASEPITLPAGGSAGASFTISCS